jgi:hypothetical protein
MGILAPPKGHFDYLVLSFIFERHGLSSLRISCKSTRYKASAGELLLRFDLSGKKMHVLFILIPPHKGRSVVEPSEIIPRFDAFLEERSPSPSDEELR